VIFWRRSTTRTSDGKRKTRSDGDKAPGLDLNRVRTLPQADRAHVAEGGNPAARHAV
jgi:hypothetical protein